MNILPLVFGCIILFSFLTLGFLREHSRTILAESSLHGFHSASRIVVNTMAEKQFVKLKSDPSKKPKTKGKKKQSKSHAFVWQRDHFPPVNNAKFNLCFLCELQTDPTAHPLYEIAAELLHLLYEDVLFKPASKEGVEYALLNAMIKAYKSKNDVQSVMDLYPDAAELKTVFYKMVKGTNRYDVGSSRGIAPLGDFFCLEKKSPAIDLSCASRTLLHAIFGEKNMLKILAEEKKKFETTHKNASITKDEFSALLASDPQHAAILQLGEQIHFSQKFPKRQTITGQENKSGILVRAKSQEG